MKLNQEQAKSKLNRSLEILLDISNKPFCLHIPELKKAAKEIHEVYNGFVKLVPLEVKSSVSDDEIERQWLDCLNNPDSEELPKTIKKYNLSEEIVDVVLKPIFTGSAKWMRSEITPEEWISVNDELPKLKVFQENGRTMRESSVEFIVTDGETSWADSFTEDGFHPSITHYKPFPPPKKS